MSWCVRSTLVAILAAASISIPGTVHASGDPCSSQAQGDDNSVVLGMTCSTPGGVTPEVPTSGASDEPVYVEYRWNSVCLSFDPSRSVTSYYVDCAAARVCPNPGDRLWDLWGRLAGPLQSWWIVSSQCLGAPPTAAQTPQPQVTPGLVLNAIRRIGLPKLAVRIQPQGKTLVNFDTNFYVTPQPFERTITLLGRSVDVEATPTQYTWLHGDGTSTSTAEPGAPYPDLSVTYAYPHSGTVTPSVQVIYSARFRVEGGAWQQIPETVTVDGPPGSLQVVEGTGVLSGDYR